MVYSIMKNEFDTKFYQEIIPVLTVLIIDDNESSARMLQIALEMVGYDVVCAFSGEEGLELAREIRPALIITDLRLPGSTMDGWAAIRALKADEVLKEIPVIVTSVEVMPDDRKRAYEAGCDHYYAKPFDIKALRAQIREYLGAP